MNSDDVIAAEKTDSDVFFMREAMKEAARAAALGEVPVGAVLVLNNEIIARGHNRMITDHDATAHAEVTVIREAGHRLGNYRLVDTVLYVTLEPCIMCAGSIIHSRISRVVYGASDYKTGADVSVFNIFQDSRHNHHPEVVSGVLAEECGRMISDFFAMRRLQKKQQREAEKEKKNATENLSDSDE